MKAIMISIKPKWIAKILNGEKTIEIRKTMPKCDLPIDVYIYCTSHKNYTQSLYEVCEEDGGGYDVDYYRPSEEDFILNGKVVAKFTLTQIWTFDKMTILTEQYNHLFIKKSCLTKEELVNYIGDNVGYAWHIDNLEIFDKPKELSVFTIPCDFKCPKLGCCYCHKNTRLNKAPQSWCYVEDGL